MRMGARLVGRHPGCVSKALQCSCMRMVCRQLGFLHRLRERCTSARLIVCSPLHVCRKGTRALDQSCLFSSLLARRVGPLLRRRVSSFFVS
jgi:hypothetical protein